MAVNTMKLFRHGKPDNWTQLNRDLGTKIKDTVKALINQAPLKFTEVGLYLMDSSKTHYAETSTNRLAIFVQSIPKEEIGITDGVIGSIAMKRMVAQEGFAELKDADGNFIAYYVEKTLELYIPWIVNELSGDDLLAVIESVVSTFTERVLKNEAYKNSWINSTNKEQLVSRITTYLSRNQKNELESAENKVRDTERHIEDLTTNLKQVYDRHKVNMKKLEQAREQGVTGLDAFLNGLEDISKHPQVTDIDVEESRVVVKIANVHAYANVNGKERRYYIGNMEVHIDISNTSVKFYGDNPRNGFWSNDPHPHVSGDSHRACLGNVATTLAELCSEMEIYAVFLTCLDFLENANTEDPAGRKIVMWDEVDEEGNIIKEADEDEGVECEHCQGHFDEDDLGDVLTNFDPETGAHLDHQSWCSACREEDATWVGKAEEYVRDEISDVVEQYYESQS